MSVESGLTSAGLKDTDACTEIGTHPTPEGNGTATVFVSSAFREYLVNLRGRRAPQFILTGR